MSYLNYLNPSFGAVVLQFIVAAFLTAVFILTKHVGRFKQKISEIVESNEK